MVFTTKSNANKELYNLDAFFNQSLVNFGNPVRQKYSKLTEEISKYKQTLFQANNTDSITYANGPEMFGKEIGLIEDSFYNVVWDIAKAKQIISQNSIPITEIPLDFVINSASENELNLNYIRVLKNTDPIIVVKYDPLNQLMVIDGSHRIMNQFMKNPSGLIKGYILKPQYHLNAMLNDMFRLLYKIHHNVTVICNYQIGNIKDFYYEIEDTRRNLYKI